jgi:hypothetical protein
MEVVDPLVINGDLPVDKVRVAKTGSESNPWVWFLREYGDKDVWKGQLTFYFSHLRLSEIIFDNCHKLCLHCGDCCKLFYSKELRSLLQDAGNGRSAEGDWR